MTTHQTGGRRWLSLIAYAGILAVAVGLGLIGWASWGNFFTQPDPPYHYEPVASAPATPPHTETPVPENIPVERYRVVAEDGEVIATAQIGKAPELGRVLLEWQGVGDPTITETASLTELLALSKAIREHVPDSAEVLAWWDTSRQLRALAGTETVFDEHLGTPLFVPKKWENAKDAVLSVEAAFWNDELTGDAPDGNFPAFVDALASAPDEGAAQLRQLTDGKRSFLVLHLVDALKVGLMRPERFPITYRDFPRTGGDVHGMIRMVKAWVESQGLGAYSVHPLGRDRIRVYALPEGVATSTLIGRLLPFSTSRSLQVDGMTLVYQVGGYWVYRIDGAAEGNDDVAGGETGDMEADPAA